MNTHPRGRYPGPRHDYSHPVDYVISFLLAVLIIACLWSVVQP